MLAYTDELRNSSVGLGMKNFLLLVMSALVIALGATLAVVLQQPDVSTFEIDRDRTAIAAEIGVVRAEGDQYTGGLIKSLLDARLAILQNTQAMLDQKRTSFIKRIALNYTIDGHIVKPASDSELNEILEELAQAEKMVAESRLDAARYSGGLLQSLKLMKVATDEMSTAQLRLKFYSAKHGIPLPILASPTAVAPDKPVGKIVKDREAL